MDLEHEEQVAFMNWRDLQAKTVDPLFSRIFAVPNGGLRDAKTGKKLKDEGVAKGMLDIAWPLPRGRYHGFYHELKAVQIDPTKRQNKPTKEQFEWIEYFNGVGYCADYSTGWEAMAQAVVEYYKLGPFDPELLIKSQLDHVELIS